MQKQEIDEMMLLIDDVNEKDVIKELGNGNNIFFALHNRGSTVTLDEPAKHISKTGEVKTLPSGAKYRVDKNGCWCKVPEDEQKGGGDEIYTYYVNRVYIGRMRIIQADSKTKMVSAIRSK